MLVSRSERADVDVGGGRRPKQVGVQHQGRRRRGQPAKVSSARALPDPGGDPARRLAPPPRALLGGTHHAPGGIPASLWHAVLMRNPTEWRFLEGFLGYGVLHPRFLFVGLEEGTREGDEERNLDVRLAHPEVFGQATANKDDALRLLYPGLAADDVQQWAVAAAIVSRITRALGESDTAPAIASLGSKTGCSLLGELLPVPRFGRATFPVTRFGFKGETAYFRAALGRNAAGALNRDGDTRPPRWVALQALVNGQGPRKRPDYIVCYGYTWRRVFDQLVGPLVAVRRSCLGDRVYMLGRTPHGSVVAITGFFKTKSRHKTDILPVHAEQLATDLVAARVPT